jgi:hypothetical protein
MSGECGKYTPEFREQAAGLVIETGRVGIQDSTRSVGAFSRDDPSLLRC